MPVNNLPPWPLYQSDNWELQDIHQHDQQEAWVQEDEEDIEIFSSI